MTVYRALKLVKEYYYPNLNRYDKKFVDDMLDGLDGLGDVSNEQAAEVMTQKQIAHTWLIAKAFGIKETTPP